MTTAVGTSSTTAALETEVIRLMKELRRERMTVEGLRQGMDAVRERHAALQAENVRLRDEIGAFRAESAYMHPWSNLHRPRRAA